MNRGVSRLIQSNLCRGFPDEPEHHWAFCRTILSRSSSMSQGGPRRSPTGSIRAIAAAYHFTNSGRFARLFKEVFGQSPSELRRAQDRTTG